MKGLLRKCEALSSNPNNLYKVSCGSTHQSPQLSCGKTGLEVTELLESDQQVKEKAPCALSSHIPHRKKQGRDVIRGGGQGTARGNPWRRSVVQLGMAPAGTLGVLTGSEPQRQLSARF